MKRPMLAATATSLNELRYPLAATPKLDGIRCIVRNGVPHTRSFKLVQNKHIRDALTGLPEGLDGELIAGDYNATQSAVMRREGEPKFRYIVFDQYGPKGYWDRVHSIQRYEDVLLPTVLHSEAELLAYEDSCLREGYEGVMLRDANGPYYEGRAPLSTLFLVKWKRFVDSEAVVIGYKEGITNVNTPEQDAFGYQKRSGLSEGKLPRGTLGSLLCVDLTTRQEVQVGSGFDEATRRDLWSRRESLVGLTVKYRYQHADGCAPRFPRFIGFREPE